MLRRFFKSCVCLTNVVFGRKKMDPLPAATRVMNLPTNRNVSENRKPENNNYNNNNNTHNNSSSSSSNNKTKIPIVIK